MSAYSYDRLLEDYRERLTGTDADLAVISEAAMAVGILNAHEMTEMDAYATCEVCERHYTLEEWIWLTPVKTKLWRLTARILREYRSCASCHAAIEFTEVMGVQRPTETQPVSAVAKREKRCDHCGASIRPGELHVVRVLVKTGLPPLRGPRHFCSDRCER